MGAVLRYDAGTLQKPRKLPNGTLRVDAHLTTIGIFEYRNPDGSVRRELRDESEVFKQDSIESFAMLPVTDDHPAEGLVNEDNASSLSKGTSGEKVRRDGDLMRAPLVITDKALVEKMRAGKTAVSNGYTCELDETPGTWRGEKYDARQTNIVGNHIAIVDVGRAGPAAQVRMDSGVRVDVPRETSMVKKKIGAVEFEVSEQISQAIDAERKDVADQLAAAKQQIETLTVSAGSLKTKLDAAEKTIADMPQAIAARTSLEAEARTHLGADAKFDGKTDGQVRAMVVEKLTAVKLDSASDEAYRVALAGAGNDNPALAKARGDAAGGTRGDKSDAPISIQEAQRRYAARVDTFNSRNRGVTQEQE